MKSLCFVVGLCFATSTFAQSVQRDIRYADSSHARHVLDVYSPEGAKNLPVVFWIHGGGWQKGDKSDVAAKPQWFMNKGFVFVSTNYRLMPEVEMETLIGDVAKAAGWTRKHIAQYGGDPDRILIGGHSAGAQLAAILCTDERYLKAEGVSFKSLIGCVPVDGDTYDVAAIIETEETRDRTHHITRNRYGHREKFGNDDAKFRELSATSHVARGKDIPPFLLFYMQGQPDTTAQAQCLAAVLREAGVSVKLFAGKETSHTRLNNDLGLPDDPATKELDEFVAKIVKE